MFDKLESLVDRLDTVLQELNDPSVASDAEPIPGFDERTK